MNAVWPGEAFKSNFERTSGSSKELCDFREARTAQFLQLPHPPRVHLRAVELRECGITAAPNFSLNFARVCQKLPKQLL
jgi:hypothetical protein